MPLNQHNMQTQKTKRISGFTMIYMQIFLSFKDIAGTPVRITRIVRGNPWGPPEDPNDQSDPITQKHPT